MTEASMAHSMNVLGRETPSRRALIRGAMAGSLAAATIGATSPARAAPSADAELIRLCHRFIAVNTRINSFFPGETNAIEDDERRNEVQNPFFEQRRDLLEEIIDARAFTLPGLIMRARAIVSEYPEWLDRNFQGDPEAEMGAAMVRDLLAMEARQ